MQYERFLTGILTKISRLPAGVRNLSIWDIDDTLFLSKNMHIYVKNGKGEVVEKLTSKQYNSRPKIAGETYDYSEFRSAGIFYDKAKAVEPNLDKARTALESNKSMVLVLTAREDFDDKETFLRKFQLYGLNMKHPHIHVVRAGNLGLGSVAGKAQVLDRCFSTRRFTSAQMYDDHKENLDAFLGLKKQFPNIRMNAFLALKSGKLKEYRR
jgi:hypothetical protein